MEFDEIRRAEVLRDARELSPRKRAQLFRTYLYDGNEHDQTLLIALCELAIEDAEGSDVGALERHLHTLKRGDRARRKSIGDAEEPDDDVLQMLSDAAIVEGIEDREFGQRQE